MLEQPRGAFDRALGQVLVLEPAGDRGQPCVVPGLAVRESLVELTDQVRRLVGHAAHLLRRGIIEPTAGAEQGGRREIVADPDGFEIGRKEQPTRPQYVVAVRILPIALRVGPKDLGRPQSRAVIVIQRRQRRQVRSALREPQMLVARPMTVVTLAGERLAATGAAVRRRTPWVERETGPVFGAHAAVGGEQCFRFRHGRETRQEQRRPLVEVCQQRGEIRRGGDLLAARRELLRRHHARTPSSAHRTGRTVAPAARAAAIAGAASSPVTKNMQPPAPDPAAFPPSAPAARSAVSSRAISGVRIPGSSVCCWLQFSESRAATRAASPARSASAIAAATSFIARSAPVTKGSPRSYAAMTRAIVAPETRDRP